MPSLIFGLSAAMALAAALLARSRSSAVGLCVRAGALLPAIRFAESRHNPRNSGSVGGNGLDFCAAIAPAMDPGMSANPESSSAQVRFTRSRGKSPYCAAHLAP